MTEAQGNYRDETRLVHMLQVLERLSSEAGEISVVGDLSADDRLTRATMYDFIVLGEAANNISDSLCASHPEIPWADVAGFRHKLVHDYSSVDYGIMFAALKNDVPTLLQKVRQLVDKLPPEPDPPKNISDFD